MYISTTVHALLSSSFCMTTTWTKPEQKKHLTISWNQGWLQNHNPQISWAKAHHSMPFSRRWPSIPPFPRGCSVLMVPKDVLTHPNLIYIGHNFYTLFLTNFSRRNNKEGRGILKLSAHIKRQRTFTCGIVWWASRIVSTTIATQCTMHMKT